MGKKPGLSMGELTNFQYAEGSDAPAKGRAPW
jgi:hypothetical protein